MYRQEGRGKSASASRRSASRDITGKKAESVLPVPVGEQISVAPASCASGIACAWGGVGTPNRSSHHAATAGCNSEKISFTGRIVFARTYVRARYERGML